MYALIITSRGTMARIKKTDAPQQLTLKIDGAHITADRFLKAVSSFVALINDVADSVTQERSAFRWIVSVEKGSAIVHFSPEQYRAEAKQLPASMIAIRDGLDTIEKHPQRPRYWSDNALRKAKDLSDVLDVTTGALDHVSVKTNAHAQQITRKTSANVDVLIGADYKSLGSIEGRLQTVTEAGGLHFVVQDAITHNKIRCFFIEDNTDEYIKAFRKRVSVYGEIRYRKDGEPVSISVHEFRILRESHELPSARDVKGIFAS